ncbi:MAG: hypothetical protein AAF196_08400 [Planctomycetota bacterium]
MATKKKTSKKRSATAQAEPEDIRAPLDPKKANFEQILKDLEEALSGLTPPEEPTQGDLVTGLVHILFADGLPCGFGQAVRERLDEELVDRNEQRITEAYELEALLLDLEIPDLLARCERMHEAFLQIYNDQNHVGLDELREGSVSDRKNFFQRVPAIEQPAINFLQSMLDLEDVMFSTRSTVRTQTRLGWDPKSKDVTDFIDRARALLAPFGHLPVDVGAPKGKTKVIRKPELSPACLLLRLAPAKNR